MWFPPHPQLPCELSTYDLWYLHDMSVFDLVRFTSLIKACLREVCVAVGSPARSMTPWLEFCATEGMPAGGSSIFHIRSHIEDLNRRGLELVYYNHWVRVYQPLVSHWSTVTIKRLTAVLCKNWNNRFPTKITVEVSMFSQGHNPCVSVWCSLLFAISSSRGLNWGNCTFSKYLDTSSNQRHHNT